MMDPADPKGWLSRRAALGGALAAAGLWPGLGWGQTTPSEGGIGGTGIVGTLSGAGGLSVNGRLLLLSRRTRAEDAQGRIDLTSLRAGDSVTIEADGLADGRLRARRIALTVPLIGTAARRGGGLTVNGVQVTGPRRVLAKAQGRVQVHGLWRGDRVVASRIAPAAAGPDVMAGATRRQGATSTLGGVPLSFRSALGNPPEGRFVTLSGAFDGRSFAATGAERERFRQPGQLRFLSVEGYLEQIGADPGYIVSGLGHSFDRAARLAQIAGTRALIEGRYVGAFRASRGLALPESPAARTALLDQRLQGGAPGVSLR